MVRYIAAFLLLCVPARAATPQLQGATILGNGGTLTIIHMPIKTADGNTIFRDVTIQLQADENGRVSFARGKLAAPVPLRAGAASAPAPEAGLTEVQPLVQAPSRPPRVQQFTNGTYAAADGSLIHVSGGGKALLEGATIWTLSSLGAGGGPLSSASWYEGQIDDNPRRHMIREAGITSLDYSYGTSDEGDGKLFGSGALIGATQTGRTLTIVSFHHGCCSNGNVPVASVTYTLSGR